MARMVLPPRALVQQLLRYDAETGRLIWLPRSRDLIIDNNKRAIWNVRYASKPAGTVRQGTGYLYIGIGGTIYSAHRLVWLHVYGAPVPHIIDHRDHNQLNNRIDNLRAASLRQNRANSFVRSDSLLGIKGVSQTKQRRFIARIGHNGQAIYLGTFDTREAAIAAYKGASASLYGEFARWNQR